MTFSTKRLGRPRLLRLTPTTILRAVVAVGCLQLHMAAQAEQTVQVVDLDVSKISQTLERPRTTGPHSAVTIGGVKFERSLSTRATSRLYLELDGQADTFSARGGVSDFAVTNTDDFRGTVGDVEFLVYGDGKLLERKGPVKKGDPTVELHVNLAGVHELLLEVTGPPGAFANWVQAQISYNGRAPFTEFTPEDRAINRVSPQPPAPRLNGAFVVGIRPGTPFLHVIAATGQRPLSFSADGLPPGLHLDPETGIITGMITHAGEYLVEVTAKNALGQVQKTLRIEVGDKLALTPPMGWNSWNVVEGLVSETVLEEMADAMVAQGFRDVGYQYIDLDDEWVIGRDAEGRPVVDPVRFPHGMKAVADYLHARGFKLGIYSCPGPTTCGGYPGTLDHEAIDVKTWTSWGVDLLKYDFCSIPRARANELYDLMGNLLANSGRSIVYSLCGPPAATGAEAKAQAWRTAGDIRDTWHLRSAGGFIDCFDLQSDDIKTGFGNVKTASFQHPGGWNDPDLLVVGTYGKGASANDEGARGGNDIEYQTQMSLWCLLSAPLLATADLRVISPAALKILTNPEVIDIDQDPLGREPALVSQQGDLEVWPSVDVSSPIRPTPRHHTREVWSKKLADDSKVLALLNRGEEPVKITAKWSDAGLTGHQRLRDLWQRKDLGVFTDHFSATVPRHGTMLLRLWPTD